VSAGKILVVDDEPQIRRIMKTTLIGAGFEIDDAKSGEEGIDKISKFHPDLVLLDINMPAWRIGSLQDDAGRQKRCDYHADGPRL
jgi:CheY-like chemotaxis protein